MQQNDVIVTVLHPALMGESGQAPIQIKICKITNTVCVHELMKLHTSVLVRWVNKTVNFFRKGETQSHVKREAQSQVT